MKTLLTQEGQGRIFVVVFEVGDEVMGSLAAYARQNNLQSAYFSGIGAFSSARIGWYNAEAAAYDETSIGSQMELASFTGDISQQNGKPFIHAHAVLGTLDGTVQAGHLIEGIVQPTLELFITEFASPLKRKDSPPGSFAPLISD